MLAVVSSYTHHVTKASTYKVLKPIKWLFISIGLLLGANQIIQAAFYYKAYRELKIAEENGYEGNYLKALMPYEYILKDYPHMPLLQANYFLTNKEFPKAINELERAKSKCPAITLYYMLGDTYKQVKDYKKAEHNYLAVSNALPNLVKPHYLLAKLYYETSQHAKWRNKALFVINFKTKGSSIEAGTMIDEIKYLYNQNKLKRMARL